jgi:hypothetical protein
VSRVTRLDGKIRRVELIGREGGTNRMILLLFLPVGGTRFGVYLSVRVRGRVRLCVGPMFGWFRFVRPASG